MTQPTAPAILEFQIHSADGSDLVEIAFTDSHSGRRFHFEVPWYAVPPLRDFFTETIALNPGRFRDTATRRLAELERAVKAGTARIGAPHCRHVTLGAAARAAAGASVSFFAM